MKIYHNNLTSTLNQGIKPVWLVFGDEPWQKNDSIALIKNHAKQQGFSETIRFTVESGFDWQSISEEYLSMSLFANQRILEIEFSSIKIGDAGHKAMLEISERLVKDCQDPHFPQDVIFMLHGPKLDGPSSNRKWFKSLMNIGCYLPLYDIESKMLPSWLNKQARALNVNLSPQASSLLITMLEGNLLALAQELQKLSLLFGNQEITLNDAEQVLIKQAKFNVFQVLDALLLGDCKKCITMLDQIQHEGVSPAQLIWAFHKEISSLNAMLFKLSQGHPLNEIYKEYRIWDKRKPLYHYALNNISLHNAECALARLADIDLLSKSNNEFNIYILLADLCITLYHGEVTQQFSLDYDYA
jgi:DNA polymerase-3 subunit delta